MGKICRVKQRTKTHKKRKAFLRVRKDVANIVNTGINLSNVNSESIKDNLVNSNINSTTLPKSDNEHRGRFKGGEGGARPPFLQSLVFIAITLKNYKLCYSKLN